MTGSNNFRVTTSKMVWIFVLSCLLGVSSATAQKKWHFGIGTGIMRLNIEGDQGFNLGQFGPVETEVDLDPDDISDLMESAIGGGGYATNGTWMVQASFSKIKLGGQPGGTLPSGATVTSDVSFEVTTGQLTVGHTVYRSGSGTVTVQPYVGFRYLKHEVGAALTSVGQDTTDVSRSFDHNWTDVLLGTSLNVALSKKIGWSTSFDAGFGGSNGTYKLATGISWRVWKFLALRPNAFYTAIDFENGEKGDADWYMYDANEFGVGLSALINF